MVYEIKVSLNVILTLSWFHAVCTLCTNENITSRELDIVQYELEKDHYEQ